MLNMNIFQNQKFIDPRYRAEIDGLRALAVLLVLFYHAFPAIIPAGFIGVDIFFVISGYLITSLLLNDISNGHFSLANFYYPHFSSTSVSINLLHVYWLVCDVPS